jgi:SH3 domain protein
MKNIRLWPIPVLFLTMVLHCQASWAAKAYIVDTKDAPIRSSPNSQSKAFATLEPGTSLEIVKGSDWTLVRFTDSEGKPREGWVATGALGARPPESTLTKELQNENAALTERLAQLEKEREQLHQREKKLSDDLSKLQTDHERLRSGSANYVALRDEYEATKTNLASAQESIQTLTQENESLRLSRRVTWFAAGAFVMFCGWLIGWFTGRHQRKRRIIYF